MTLGASLVSDLLVKLGDSREEKFTSALLYTWLDQAQKEFVNVIMPIRHVEATTVNSSQESFALPADCIMVDGVVSRRGWTKKVQRVTRTDFINQKTAVETAVATDPTIWTEQDGRVYVYPPYSGSSLTTSLGSAVGTASTTMTMNSTGNLRTNGRVLVDSEEVEYNGKSTTAIFNCLRGAGNTAAASHASDATVTQCDLELHYRRHATALTSSASPEIRSIYHEKLELYAMYLGYMQEGDTNKARMAYDLWQQALKEAQYTSMREHLGPLGVRDTETQLISGNYGPL